MERIKEEMFKILLTKNAVKTIEVMQDNNIMSYIMPDAKYLDSLDFIKKLVNGRILENKALLYLFTMYQPDVPFAENLAQRLKFSRKERQKFVSWAEEVTLNQLLEDKSRLHLAYEYGKEFCLEKLLLITARNKEPLPNFWGLYDAIEHMEVPTFPLRGQDLVDKGVETAQIGRILKEREQAWINSGFRLSKEELLEPKYNKVS